MRRRPAIRTIKVEPVLEPSPEALRRLTRIRRLAWVMDRSIPIGGGMRIGFDPIIGLVPGVGDLIGAAISCWLIHQAAALLGLPLRVLARMGLNVAVEATFGTVPIFGNIFDAAWQANHRNFRLVEARYDARMRPRSARRIALAFALLVAGFLALLALLIVLIVRGLIWLLTGN
jgi:hypothetical protein